MDEWFGSCLAHGEVSVLLDEFGHCPQCRAQDANGNDLGYAGPDGRTLYYRGTPVGSPIDWDRICRENKIGPWRE